MARFLLYAPLALGPWFALAWILTVALSWLVWLAVVFAVIVLAAGIAAIAFVVYLLVAGFTPREIRERFPNLPNMGLTSEQKTGCLAWMVMLLVVLIAVFEVAPPVTLFIPAALTVWFVVRYRREQRLRADAPVPNGHLDAPAGLLASVLLEPGGVGRAAAFGPRPRHPCPKWRH